MEGVIFNYIWKFTVQRYSLSIFLIPQRHLALWSKLTNRMADVIIFIFINRMNIQMFKLYPICRQKKSLFVAIYDHRQCSLKRSD